MELAAWLPSPNLVPCTEARMAEEAREEYRAGQTKPLDEILDNESLS